MKQKLFGFLRSDRRGLALITVLGVVTLATILILALFSVSDAEFKASQVYRDGADAKHLAESAVNIVIGQIQSAATGVGAPTAPTGPAALGTTIWASQPGAVRVYNSAGAFIIGRTLYSSSQMVWNVGGTLGEQQMAQNTPAAAWATSLDQWVDLNRPVERLATGGTTNVYFPIFDPRSAPPIGSTSAAGGMVDAYGSPAVEGFQVLARSDGAGKSVTSDSLGVKLVGVPNSRRLPMPVEWLYVKKDGSVGTVVQPAGGEATWAGASGKEPTADNPIIGRVGFWTDDESCKININTAGEPGFWSEPTALHERERHWADSPPAIFEYQRYPGHPATVALSTVFSPGFNPNNYFPSGSYPQANLTFKNAIYDFVPKLAMGGTNDGQVPFAPNDLALGATQTAAPSLQTLENVIMASKAETLFPSIDEALFNNKPGSGTKRTPRSLRSINGIENMTADNLSRARAFLTAHSKAPETNMFGLPRVAIWPVPDTSTPSGGGNYLDYRTGFDTAVAVCSRVGNTAGSALTETANTYYFRRLDPSSHLTDMGRNPKGAGGGSGLTRNGNLMTYLDNLVHLTMPGGASFAQKYDGGDAEQILVEIFDYIRCTNLYDGFLSGKTSGGHDDNERRDEGLPNKYKTPVTVLWDQAPNRTQYFTYTPPRFTVKRSSGDEGLVGATTQAANQYNADPEWVKTGTYPGHGQVKPIEWNDPGTGRTLKGFGRFPTISEVGLHFICSGDGRPFDKNAGSYAITNGATTIYSGGRSAEKIDVSKANQRTGLTIPGPNGPTKAYFWSNIPPYPNADMFKAWGCDLTKAGFGTKNDPTFHPGWQAANWNCTLDFDPSTRAGIQLLPNEKRIQICLLIETFIPAVGYTRYTPDFTMVLKPDQVSGIQVLNSAGKWVSVFSTTDPHLVVQSTYAFAGDERGLNASHDISPLGGHFSPAAITNGRQVAAMGKMPKDPSYQDKASGSLHTAMLNFPLVSNFVTVAGWDSSGKPSNLQFRVAKPLEIDIYATHDWQGTLQPANGVASQSVKVAFPPGTQTTPVPHLVVFSSERTDRVDANGNRVAFNPYPAPHWWTFNYAGAVNRYAGEPDIISARAGTIAWKVTEQAIGDIQKQLTYGRFFTPSIGAVWTIDGLSGTSTKNVPGGGLIYGWSPVSTFSGVRSNPDKDLGLVNTYIPPASPLSMGTYDFYGSDSVRSMIPAHGDYRILAARKEVNATVWQQHPVWTKYPNRLFAHSLSGSYSDAVVGFDLGGINDTTSNPQYRLVPNVYYEPSSGTDGDGKTGRLATIPDTPLSKDAMDASTRYRDFDNGPGNLRDGPYINKPDDGNLSVLKFWHGHGTNDKSGVQQGFYVVRNTYFTSSFLQLPATSAFFTPNRIISSPGMFGSLPTGVWGSIGPHGEGKLRGNLSGKEKDGIPWRTLLFRADVDGHFGAASWAKGPAGGGVAPADHYFMDLFFMPIVEPYAITDSYATAGKINLNYQIVPFTYIRRATAVYAAMKGEMITAYSSADTDPRKASGLPASDTNTVAYKKIKDVNPLPNTLWDEVTDKMHWHRDISLDETVKQLDERFAFKGINAIGSVGLMLAPSQICELHLIPVIPAGTARQGKGILPGEPEMTGLNENNRHDAMLAYWKHNDLTGDNTRERPYANLYQKFTTRSNTFQVYYIAQTIRKARSLLPTQVDTRRDTVTSEYRGSAILERYLDFGPAGSAKLATYDYGAGRPLTGMPSLEQFYHYRVIEEKQFSP